LNDVTANASTRLQRMTIFVRGAGSVHGLRPRMTAERGLP